MLLEGSIINWTKSKQLRLSFFSNDSNNTKINSKNDQNEELDAFSMHFHYLKFYSELEKKNTELLQNDIKQLFEVTHANISILNYSNVPSYLNFNIKQHVEHLKQILRICGRTVVHESFDADLEDSDNLKSLFDCLIELQNILLNDFKDLETELNEILLPSLNCIVINDIIDKHLHNSNIAIDFIARCKDSTRNQKEIRDLKGYLTELQNKEYYSHNYNFTMLKTLEANHFEHYLRFLFLSELQSKLWLLTYEIADNIFCLSDSCYIFYSKKKFY